MTALTPLELPIAALPLQGRVALVTSGATGIGAAISRALAAAGASVAVNHLAQIHQARAVLGDVRRESRTGIEVSADLTDPNAVAAMTSQVESELGPIDILVNNAGTYPRTPWEDLGEAEWDGAIESNLTIHYLTCRDRTGPEFSQGGRGEYFLEDIPLNTEALDAINLPPQEIASVLREAVERGELLATR
ncbi:SDR family NAD(P)-dependent oxidoreductase [Streptomyces marincola]|uniref:SDR family NAD(P)-dependent oxidoreductase n=1 Tax=Streptomyces marincola TaxID=2878388 RepID=UPI001CF58B24|nr:SDR family NAD(P)-dependent oxidoreductase [Streptomyces marincola]UCM88941.1 SDR family NAD(P)-dependent oxidoreductase [Streptomyces marincola]